MSETRKHSDNDASLWETKDFFPFSIVRMPHLSNNSFSNISDALLGAKILAVARTVTKLENVM